VKFLADNQSRLEDEAPCFTKPSHDTSRTRPRHVSAQSYHPKGKRVKCSLVEERERFTTVGVEELRQKSERKRAHVLKAANHLRWGRSEDCMKEGKKRHRFFRGIQTFGEKGDWIARLNWGRPLRGDRGDYRMNTERKTYHLKQGGT